MSDSTVRYCMDQETLFRLDLLIRLALEEDLADRGDCTSLAVVPGRVPGRAAVKARRAGTACGGEVFERVCRAAGAEVAVRLEVGDGARFERGDRLAVLEGDARDLLLVERTCLNFFGRLCGIATLTSAYVDAVAGTGARIHDTRKTTPGWRRLEKYAVQCGGGVNHRMGLYDAILIKDNHLAMLGQLVGTETAVVGEAMRRGRAWNAAHPGQAVVVQIEVDRLGQLHQALECRPDMILLDNMSLELLRESVALRDRFAPGVLLEASGGVTLDTVRRIAETGVDRISVGALTHSAASLDVGLDWESG
jgi:nicotinate-nucleotide pyrophosphorylase (carboxylating)